MVALLHISVAVDQFFKLFIEHFQTMDVDEVLYVLETHLKTV